MLECPKCQHDNDLGRIFCTKCGEKLDITHVGPPSGISRKGKKGKKSPPFKEMLSITAGKFGKVILLAAITALVTLVWLPPDLQRTTFYVQNAEAYKTKIELMTSAAPDIVSEIAFEEGDINASMAEAVRTTTEGAGEGWKMRLNSVYFSLRDDLVVVTAENKIKWFRLILQLEAKPFETDGKWEFIPTAVRIGRFQLAPQLGGKKADDAILQKLLDFSFKRLWAGAESEKQILESVSKVVVKPGKIILTSKKSA